MSNEHKQLDTRIEIVTPENIAFQYQVAGPFRRFAAYLIDVIIRLTVFAILSFVFLLAFGIAGMSGVGAMLSLVFYFVLDWFFGGLFETFWNGQTPGKHLLRLRAISVTGRPLNAWQAILRNLLRLGDAWPIVYFVPTYQLAFLATMCNRRFQRLGDLMCGTMVVVEEPLPLYGVVRVSEPAALNLAAELPANFEASRSLARALSAYVARRPAIGPARRAEIARHVGEPLRIRFGLPPSTSHDLLLCALYHQAFVADRSPTGNSPFRPAQLAATR